MLEDYILSREGTDTTRLLDDWDWLLEGPHRIVLVTRMGDAFLQDPEGRVIFLDTLEGRAKPAAPSLDAFNQRLAAGQIDPDWFSPDLLAIVQGRGDRLRSGQCFSYKVPPALGGSLDSSNVGIIDVVVHFSISGQLHRQIKDLKPGTRIGGVEFQES